MKIRKVLKKREFALVYVCIALYILVGIIEPKIFSTAALYDIFLGLPILLLVALGEMGEIISKNVDVSLGSVLAFSAVITGTLFIYIEGIPLIIAVIAAILCGAILCIINGMLVRLFKLPSIIITLGTMNLYRGLLFIILNNKQINNSNIPKDLIMLSTKENAILIFPITFIIVIAIAFLFHLFLTKTNLGRQIFAVGDNEFAAKLRGINTNKVVISTFGISGALTGLGAIFYLSRIGYVTPNSAGVGLEFKAIAAAVIGGTSMNGGYGSVLGVFSGCLLLTLINNSVIYLGISAYWQNAAYGLIIIIAALIEMLINNKRMQKVGVAI